MRVVRACSVRRQRREKKHKYPVELDGARDH